MRPSQLIDTTSAVALVLMSASMAVLRYLATRTWRSLHSHSPGRTR